jgi:hypothetical protein
MVQVVAAGAMLEVGLEAASTFAAAADGVADFVIAVGVAAAAAVVVAAGMQGCRSVRSFGR